MTLVWYNWLIDQNWSQQCTSSLHKILFYLVARLPFFVLSEGILTEWRGWLTNSWATGHEAVYNKGGMGEIRTLGQEVRVSVLNSCNELEPGGARRWRSGAGNVNPVFHVHQRFAHHIDKEMIMSRGNWLLAEGNLPLRGKYVLWISCFWDVAHCECYGACVSLNHWLIQGERVHWWVRGQNGLDMTKGPLGPGPRVNQEGSSWTWIRYGEQARRVSQWASGCY